MNLYLVLLLEVPRAAPETARARVVGAWPWSWLAQLHLALVTRRARRPNLFLAGTATAMASMPVADLDASEATKSMLRRWMEAAS